MHFCIFMEPRCCNFLKGSTIVQPSIRSNKINWWKPLLYLVKHIFRNQLQKNILKNKQQIVSHNINRNHQNSKGPHTKKPNNTVM